MSKAADRGTDKSQGVQESPLVPNKRLMEIYRSMAEARLLEEQRAERKARVPGRGQEACRASVLAGLEPEDLVSDLSTVATSALLMGAGPENLLDQRDEVQPGMLPSGEKDGDRLRMALGAAVAMKQARQRRMVVVFAEPDGAKPSVWREVLRAAAERELPILFVVLPVKQRKKGARSLSALATAMKVPGIAVDAADPIALYRVAQESIGRARAGGGAVLMECLWFRVEGEPRERRPDPLEVLRRRLVERGVCEEPWFEQVHEDFAQRLASR